MQLIATEKKMGVKLSTVSSNLWLFEESRSILSIVMAVEDLGLPPLTCNTSILSTQKQLNDQYIIQHLARKVIN